MPVYFAFRKQKPLPNKAFGSGFYEEEKLTEFLAQVSSGVGVGVCSHLFGRAAAHHIAAGVAPFEPHVYDVVGTFDYLHVVLDDDDGVSFLYQCVERPEQRFYVVYVQTGGRLVEHEYRRLLFFVAQEIRQLHPLVFAAREGGGGLPHFYVAQPHALQRLQPSYDFFLGRPVAFGEKFHCLIHRHVENVGDVFAAILHFENVRLEPFAVARFAREHEVCHELHFDRNRAVAFALLAAAAFDVERKMRRREAHLLGEFLFGEQLAYFVERFQVDGGIGAGGMPDRILIHEFDVLHQLHIARQAAVGAGRFALAFVVACQRAVEDIAHERRFSRTAHARYDRHHVEREAHGNVFEVVVYGAFHFDIVVPASPHGGHFDALFSREVFCRVAVFGFREVGEVALIHHFAAEPPRLRSDVDDVVGGADYLLVVLHHDDRVAQLLQAAQHADEPLGVARMQPDARFVENVERAD